MRGGPKKNDAWATPKHWRHVWVRLDHSNFPPMPGLILDWRRKNGWQARVLWIDNRHLREVIREEWLPARQIRPAPSDINVWNDGPWR